MCHIIGHSPPLTPLWLMSSFVQNLHSCCICLKKQRPPTLLIPQASLQCTSALLPLHRPALHACSVRGVTPAATAGHGPLNTPLPSGSLCWLGFRENSRGKQQQQQPNCSEDSFSLSAANPQPHPPCPTARTRSLAFSFLRSVGCEGTKILEIHRGRSREDLC